MGKIKGWKKVGMMGKRPRWDNIITKNSIIVQTDTMDKYWDIIIYYSNFNKQLAHFKTKEKAMKYAVRYMKSHPRG